MKHISVLFFALLFGLSAQAQSVRCDSGDCRSGLGTATLVDSDGLETTYEGSWRDGLPYGDGTLTFPDSTHFTGRMYDGEPRDGGVAWRNGSTYEGWILDHKLHGWGTYYSSVVEVAWEGRFEGGQADNIQPILAEGDDRTIGLNVANMGIPSLDDIFSEQHATALSQRRELLIDSLRAHDLDSVAEEVSSDPDFITGILSVRTEKGYVSRYAGRHPGLLALLLDSGADPNFIANGSPNPVLDATVRHISGHEEGLTLLLDAGADPNLYLGGSLTPLTTAASFCSVATVDLLLTAGADPNACASDEPCISHGGFDSVLRSERAYEKARVARDRASDDDKRERCETIVARLYPYTDTPM